MVVENIFRYDSVLKLQSSEDKNDKCAFLKKL